MVSSLLTSSTRLDLDKQIHRLVASMIMPVLYDYPMLMSEADEAIERIEEFNRCISDASALLKGAYLVVIFPWMMHIPARS